MNPILIDTNAYTAFKRGDAETVDIVQLAPFIAMNTTVLGELWAGFKVGTRDARNREELEIFLSSPRVTLDAVDRGTAEQYAVLFAFLRASGSPLPTNEIWIAASAMQHSLRLFTFDAHFQKVRGLRLGATMAELSAP